MYGRAKSQTSLYKLMTGVRTEGQTVGWIVGRTDGQTDEQKNSL